MSLGVGVAVAAALAVLLPTVFVPYLYPLFHLEGLALRIAVTMCVVYICMMPMKAFDITNITGSSGPAAMPAWLRHRPGSPVGGGGTPDCPGRPGAGRAGDHRVPVHPDGKPVQNAAWHPAAAEPQVDQ